MQYSYAIAERMNAMTPDLFEEMRRAMVVSQLRPDGVTDPRVIDAMGCRVKTMCPPIAARRLMQIA
jgi:hypothetical protein